MTRSRPALSVCLLASRPAEQVLPLLRLVRPLADELLVAVDERAPVGTAQECAALADRSFSLVVQAPARAIGWLFHECRGDWILRLDDDERPSAALLAGLRDQLRGRATSVMIPRRWLFPDRGRYIADQPWTPDYQLRLFRNVPGIWRFPGLRHDNFNLFGERRLAELPIYHLDLVLNDLDARRQKAANYERDRPGHAAEGFPVNRMYTPELLAHVRTSRVPAEDRGLLEGVVAEDEPRTGSGRVEAVEVAVTRRYDPVRRIDPGLQRASITLPRDLPPLRAGETRLTEVDVTNLGTETWGAHDQPPVTRLSSRWYARDGDRLGEGPRAVFGEAVAAGEGTRVLLPVTAPAWPGRYELEIGVLLEGVSWFGGSHRVKVAVPASPDRSMLGVPEGPAGVEVEPLKRSARLAIGERTTLPVRVSNTGPRALDSSGSAGAPVSVSCRWLDRRGVVVVTDAPRTSLGRLEPGASTSVDLDLAAPVRSGRYTIEIDLVREGVAWLGAARSLTVEVRAGRAHRARRSISTARATIRSAVARRSVIPRLIHRIWLGGEPLPPEFAAYGESWREHHPEWELRLWGDREATHLLPSGLLDRSRSHAETADVLRYELLRRFGGVYVDTDVECRRPLDPLLDGASAVGAWETPYRLGTAVLAATPHHRVFETAARESLLTLGLGLNSVESTGPGFLSQIVAECPSVLVYPREVFYPYRWDETHRRLEAFPDSYAVHHWSMTWVEGDHAQRERG